MTITILEGNSLETLKNLQPASVQCVVTSPPYYGLRDYGMDGQIGLEASPEIFVDNLVAVFREVWRVLKDDGTLWLNLGDSYAGSSKGQGGILNSPKQRSNHGSYFGAPLKTNKINRLKPKDLIGIPWMVAFALRADGWYLRSEIIWHKPNPMPESVTDRPTKSHEQIFLFSKSQSYYYDADAIKEPSKDPEDNRVERGRGNRKRFPTERIAGIRGSGVYPMANKRDVWTVTIKPYKEAHFATFPPDLIEPCILAGSKPGDIILDPFNGSGTTGAVAVKHHRDYIGCEINPKYIQLTHRRLARVQLVLFASIT